jgi:hypothetical protein
VRPHEKLVLESLSVDEAANQLAARPEHELKHNPIAILASMLILERIKSHSVTLFVRTILPARIEPGRVEDMGKEEKVIIDAARSLGGRTEELADMLEHVWKTGISTHDDIICEPSNEGHANAVEGEIRSLLGALILYRRIFPSSILSHSANSNGVSILLSPPPSPPRRNAALHMALRRTLGSSVFDFSAEDGKGDVAAEQSLGIALEEARDCVVDMLVDFERQSRVGS